MAHQEHLLLVAGGVAAALRACAALRFLLLQALQARRLALSKRSRALVSAHFLHLRIRVLLATAVVTNTVGKITDKLVNSAMKAIID